MKNNQKIVDFMKKNAVYFILALCVLAVGLSITFMLINTSKNSLDNIIPPIEEDVVNPGGDGEIDGPVINPDNPDIEPVDKPIIFIMPVDSPTKINDYSETMVFNSTLGHYSAHKAIDFFAPEGTAVKAVYDGTVFKVEKNMINGVTVTIDHGNGLMTEYNSLADVNAISKGQKVAKGDTIGEVALTNRTEYKDGAHLHFSVIEDNKVIDPAKYLVMGEK